MRVLVCGGRDYPDRLRVFRELDSIAECTAENMLGRPMTIIAGGASGADEAAADWAVISWKALEVYPADWKAHGRAAGPIRNQRMIDEGKPDLVLAFPGGRGTADMVKRAKDAGIEVREVSPSANVHGG